MLSRTIRNGLIWITIPDLRLIVDDYVNNGTLFNISKNRHQGLLSPEAVVFSKTAKIHVGKNEYSWAFLISSSKNVPLMVRARVWSKLWCVGIAVPLMKTRYFKWAIQQAKQVALHSWVFCPLLLCVEETNFTVHDYRWLHKGFSISGLRFPLQNEVFPKLFWNQILRNSSICNEER